MKIVDEIWISRFHTLHVKQKGDEKRNEPLHNDINMTSEDYEHFMAVITRKMVDWKSYLNDKVFASGVPLPFWNLSV